jgi:hypothetical protein
VTVIGEAVVETRVQVAPASMLYSYPKSVDPPFEPAVKATDNVALPGVTAVTVGIPGVVKGTALTDADEPLPALFVARSSIAYVEPLFKVVSTIGEDIELVHAPPLTRYE